MHRIIRVVRSVLSVALLAPIIVTGCGSDPGSIALSAPAQDTPSAPTARRDIVVPASAATTAATAISSWVLHPLPDGGQQLRGIGPQGLRVQIESPRYASRTAGSLALSLFDDAGHETQGFLTVIDGNVVDRSLPAGAGELAQHMHDDLTQAPDFYNWSDCSTAQWNEAAAVTAVVVAGVAVVAAGVAVGLACFTPAVIIVADCAAAGAAEAAALATLAAANAAEYQASSAMHAACDNLCTGDGWCTSRYGSGWSCNSEGSCEQVISTVCFPCQTVSCGWDFTCVTASNPGAAWCGECGGGGGGDGKCVDDDACGQSGTCIDGYCLTE